MTQKLQTPFIAIFCLLLIGCTKAPTIQALPTQEVLQNAAKASQTLESSAYTIDIDYQTAVGPLSIGGTAFIDGILHSGGEQVAFTLSTKSSGEYEKKPFSLNATFDVIVASAQEVFLKVSSLSTDPSDMFVSPAVAQRVKNQWWLLPTEKRDPQLSVTPDPRLLNMQAQVVRVTKDNGIIPIDDRNMYNYDVEIDLDKLIAYIQATSSEEVDVDQVRAMAETTELKGVLWIDAETFYIHRIQWFISKPGNDTGYGTFSLSFDARFSDHNSVDPIAPPIEFLPFNPSLFIGEDYSGSEPASSDRMDAVPVEAQQKIIEDLLNDSDVFPNNPPL